MRCDLLKEIITEYKTYFTAHPIEKEMIIETINRRTREGFYGISFFKNEELQTKLSELMDRVYKVNRLLSCYIDYEGFEKLLESMDELDVNMLSSIKQYRPIDFSGYISLNDKGTREESTIVLISNILKQLEITGMMCNYAPIKSFRTKGSFQKAIDTKNMMLELRAFLYNQLQSISSFMSMVMTPFQDMNIKECDG